ncbi:hypothetical protein PWT90_04589 [Aphanocladium album]|nr:hypothetical protein PWT90_04589 [Aphanocladium album]
MSDESSQKMLLSEVATLNSLRRKTAVPVPEVCSFSETWQNPIGVPYILMSKAAGRPLSDYDWADVQCLSPALVWQHRDSLEDYGIERDPLLHEDQYFNALISAFIGHATELPLMNHAFFAPLPDHSDYADWASYRVAVGRWNDYVAMGSKIESGQNRFAYCLAGQVLRDMMPHFSVGRKGYTLSHPDLHVDNIFVDDSFNITCIIDWGSASTGPVAEPMATPRLSNNPPEQIVSAFRQGFDPQNLISSESWRRSEMMRLFTRLIRLMSIHDYTVFKALYLLVYKTATDEESIALHFNSLARHESNQELLARLQADDATADEIEQEELAAFGNLAGKDDSRAVARKLTFMAEVNPNFVTSPKLWKLIESALKTE